MNHLKILAACVILASCRDLRDPEPPAPAYDPEIAELLETRCVRCHGSDDDAGAGLRLDHYLGALACSRDGAALLEVVERADHAKRLSREQTDRLRAWVERDAPLRDHGVHAPGISNPRSRDWHGLLAARDGFGPIVRASHPDACGRCHSGVPNPAATIVPAPGATACTDCHRAEGGVLACGTCHGDGGSRAHPPRDACLFGEQPADAHRAHLERSPLSSTLRLECATCHPPASAALGGTHANGRLEIAFDPALAGERASFDPETRSCAVRCHAGAQPQFDETGPLGCDSCHGSPPRDHYAGTCTDCHHEANADGTGLLASALHLNGRVDLGDGSGGCGACHGRGDDPLPRTPSHVLHRDTRLTTAVRCNECHPVPEAVTSPGHLDRGETSPVDFDWGERAAARGREPSFVTGGCREVACHGAGLAGVSEPAFRWDAAPRNACAGCHGLPPGGDHPRAMGCASLACHGTEVSLGPSGQPVISEDGRVLHIDGRIDTLPRTAAP